MFRVLATTLLIASVASPSFACNYSQTSAVDSQSVTAAAQPAATAPCPTCVVPDHAPSGTPSATPQNPS